LGKKFSFYLVVFLSRETLIFGDETRSRRLFLAGNSFFWRRNPFSSSFFGWKLLFLATRSFLVVIFTRKTSFFSDETSSRRLFEPGNAPFWRRDPFSSSFLLGKLLFLATRFILVTILRWKTHFLATKPVLVVFLSQEIHFFGDEIRSRRLFLAGNSLFWRRDPFSSSFLLGKLLFLATKPVLVVFFWLETHFSGDETRSRRLFLAGNSFFWRRDPLSSSF
jgi:hypothetical protein